MSHSTSPFNKGESNKEKHIIFPKINESKIFFVNTYQKNRNLSKSLDIKLPNLQVKNSNNFTMFIPESECELKSILRNSVKMKKNKEIFEQFKLGKSVKFIDEVDEENDISSKKSNYDICNNNDIYQEELNKEILTMKNSKFKFGTSCSELEANENIIENEEFNKYDSNNKNSESKKKIKKNLAQIINVPSYRNYNIYRFNSNEFIKKNEIGEDTNVKCKCCLIF